MSKETNTEIKYKRTDLKWSNYIEYLENAINNSKAAKRAEIKPMATPKGAGDSHLTSRATHQRLAAEIIKKIAHELNLNESYAYIGMLFHDAGHPFSAHEGEEIFNLIGRLNNCGYFHHNAKGVEVILSEDICTKAINMIPGIENNPELRRQLEDEFYYILDIVISHDGEATKKDIDKEAENYSSMKEAVLTKLRLSNSQNEYKHIAQTDEGKLAKIADVLAYLPTDINDGFRLGIVNGFSKDYLECFGTMFSKDDTLDKKGKIAFGKKILTEIQARKLQETEADMHNEKNQEILQYAFEIKKAAKEQGIDFFTLTPEKREKLEQIIEAKIDEIEKSRNLSTQTERQMFYSDMNKLREFTSKLTHIGSSVMEEITSRMREYFINDFINNSKETGNLGFSEEAEDLFYKIKKINYSEIVQYTKWDYQLVGQPDAANKLVRLAAKSLIQSGAIRDKFYDRSIREKIGDSQALEYMTTPTRDENEYYKKNKRILFNEPKGISLKGKFYSQDSKKLHRNAFRKTVNDFLRKQGQSFASKYMNVFNAIPYTVRQNVECALNGTITNSDFLQNHQKSYNAKLIRRMISQYGTLENAKKHKDEFINELIDEERNKMEEKMAIQIAIDYLSGMTDRSFNDLAIRTGFMKHDQIQDAHRGEKPSESVLKLIYNLEQADEHDMD